MLPFLCLLLSLPLPGVQSINEHSICTVRCAQFHIVGIEHGGDEAAGGLHGNGTALALNATANATAQALRAFL